MHTTDNLAAYIASHPEFARAPKHSVRQQFFTFEDRFAVLDYLEAFGGFCDGWSQWDEHAMLESLIASVVDGKRHTADEIHDLISELEHEYALDESDPGPRY